MLIPILDIASLMLRSQIAPRFGLQSLFLLFVSGICEVDGPSIDLDVMCSFSYFPGSVLVGGTSVSLGIIPANKSHCLIKFTLFPMAEWMTFLLLHKLFYDFCNNGGNQSVDQIYERSPIFEWSSRAVPHLSTNPLHLQLDEEKTSI